MSDERYIFPRCDFRDLGRATQRAHPDPKPAQATIQDDRTKAQERTHHRAIMAHDPGMSGWGKAPGGKSLCVWACAPGVKIDAVLQWVQSRSDMCGATEIDLNDWSPPDDAAHVHIYLCNVGHPATVN